MSPKTAVAIAEPHEAIFEFDGDPEEGDLQFVKGKIVMVTEKGDSDGEGRDGKWWKGFVHGKPETVGQFPSSYVKPYAGTLPEVAPAPAPGPTPTPATAPNQSARQDIMPPNLTKMEQMLWRRKHSASAPAPEPEPEPEPEPAQQLPKKVVPGPLAKAGKRAD